MVKFLCSAAFVVMVSAFVETQPARAQAADDLSSRENEVERTGFGVVGAGVLAGENLADEAGNALENEAIRDLDALKEALPPTRTPSPTPTPQDDDLQDIEKGIQTLERDAQSLK